MPMTKSDRYTIEEGSASAVALDGIEAGIKDVKELRRERNASKGSSVALDIQADVKEEDLTGSNNCPSDELVDELRRDTSEQGDKEAYVAVAVPTRWSQYKGAIGAVFLFIVAATLALGIVFGIENRNEPATRITSSPSQQPTYNCIVRDDGALTDECLSCSVALDGGVGIIAMNHFNRVRFLSLHNQTLEAVSDRYVDFSYGPVAISGDVAILGVNGSVHMFERVANKTDTWNETTFCHMGWGCEEAAWFSVDVDGDVMAVGAPDVLGVDVVGSVHVYHRQHDGTTWRGTPWVPLFAFLSSDPDDRFGRVVVVKGDRIAVAYQGAVQTFEMRYTRPGSDVVPYYWTQMGNPTVREECGNESDFGFGYSIALVGENGLLVGCPLDNDSVGSVRYYTKDSSTGTYIERQIITPHDQSIKYFGGGDTQLKVEGDHVIISTHEALKGSVFLFTLVDDQWIETARIIAPDGIKHFGEHTALSGGRVIVSSETNVHSYFLNCV